MSVQLVGVATAMDLMLTGKNLRPDKALQAGLVDEVVPAGQLRDAAKAAGAAPAPAPPARRLGQRLLEPAGRARLRGRQDRAAGAPPRAHASTTLRRTRSSTCGARHGASPRTAYEAEAQSVARLVCTPTSRNLVRVFFLQERLKALGGKDLPTGGHVHVVGAGVMGGDIAAWCALRGFTVTLQDRGAEFVQPALDRAQGLLREAQPRARQGGRATWRACRRTSRAAASSAPTS